MMKDYVILEAQTPVELIEKVKMAMKNGWETLGGIHSYEIDGFFVFCQAMGK